MFSDGHSDSIDADGTVAGCYQVQGVSGTGASVTVTRIGDGPSCQGISHVDIVLGSANTGGGGQVTLCHMQGNTFTLLTVPTAEEAAHRAHGDVNPNTAGTCTSGGTSGGATVTLCHMSGSTFALLTVPTTEEAAHRAHGDVNPNTAGACTNTTGGNTGGSGTAGGSGTLGGQGGPVRGGVAAGQGGPGGGVLPNTAVPAADFLSSIGGALLALSGIGFAAGRRVRD
jgi:hypothetical protein